MSNQEQKEMELLSAYLDNELEGNDQERVSAFLTASPEARQALEELRHTKSLFAATPKIQAPVDFLDALELQAERFQETYARKTFWSWSNPWAWTPSLAAAAALVMAIGLHTPQQIPLETLMAAHASSQTQLGIHQNLLDAAHYVTVMETNQRAKV